MQIIYLKNVFRRNNDNGFHRSGMHTYYVLSSPYYGSSGLHCRTCAKFCQGSCRKRPQPCASNTTFLDDVSGCAGAIFGSVPTCTSAQGQLQEGPSALWLVPDPACSLGDPILASPSLQVDPPLILLKP